MSRSSAILLSVLLRFVSKFSGSVFFILIPFMASSLLVSSQSVQTLIPIFLLGSAVSQLFVGSLADVFGKRQILFVLLSCFVAGSICCALSHSLWMLQLSVFTVALGVGAIAGVGNTLIFDGYKNVSKAARALSLSSILVIWAPALAMNAGVAISQFDWRYFFWVQALSGLILLVMTWLDVPRFVATKQPILQKFRESTRGYFQLLANRQYRAISWRMCLTGGGIVVFYSVGLPHLQEVFGSTIAAVGWVPVAIVGSNSLGRLVSGMMPDSVETRHMSAVGTGCCLISSLAMIGLGFIQSNALLTLAPMSLYVVGVGLMFSPQRAELMQVSAGKTVTSESLLGILMALSGSVLAFLATTVASLVTAVPLSTGFLLLTMSLLATGLRPTALLRYAAAREISRRIAPGMSQT